MNVTKIVKKIVSLYFFESDDIFLMELYLRYKLLKS